MADADAADLLGVDELQYAVPAEPEDGLEVGYRQEQGQVSKAGLTLRVGDAAGQIGHEVGAEDAEALAHMDAPQLLTAGELVGGALAHLQDLGHVLDCHDEGEVIKGGGTGHYRAPPSWPAEREVR